MPIEVNGIVLIKKWQKIGLNFKQDGERRALSFTKLLSILTFPLTKSEITSHFPIFKVKSSNEAEGIEFLK